jgi:formylglycine-generating enzyme required for sulfatase activity
VTVLGDGERRTLNTEARRGTENGARRNDDGKRRGAEIAEGRRGSRRIGLEPAGGCVWRRSWTEDPEPGSVLPMGSSLQGASRVLLMVAALCGTALGDTFLLESGQRIVGSDPVEHVDEHKVRWVRVKTTYGTATFQKKLLKSVVRGEREPGALRAASIVVTTLLGTVERSGDGGKTWARVPWPVRTSTRAEVPETALPVNEPNRFVAPGDRVRTGEGSAIDFDLGFAVVHVAAGSTVNFPTAGDATFDLLGGAAGARVAPAPAGRKFRVQTPQATLAVRGTQFSVRAGATTRVAVGEGEVEVGGLVVAHGRAAEGDAASGMVLVEPDTDDRALLRRLSTTFARPRFDWVIVSGGEFEMGSELAPNSKPVHRVKVPPFAMSRCEITNAQYLEFVRWFQAHGDHGFCHPDEPPGRLHTPWSGGPARENFRWDDAMKEPERPVTGVDWFSAWSFCAWSGVRLPSEAQWEYAASGGRDTAWPWGDTAEGIEEHEWVVTNSCDPPLDVSQAPRRLRWGSSEWRAWVCEQVIGKKLWMHAVGTRSANPLGLHDVLGNVQEWCWDVMHETYVGTPTDGTPRLDRKGAVVRFGQVGRVIRGGHFQDIGAVPTSSVPPSVPPTLGRHRRCLGCTEADVVTGFRVAWASPQ